MNNRKKLGLWLVIGPTALFGAIGILYTMLNFVFSTFVDTTSTSVLFGQTSPIESVVNVILFLIGALNVLIWLPALIIGIVLLATPSQPTSKQ